MLPLLALAALVSGCLVETNDPSPVIVHDSGSLVVDWTIDDSKSPNTCDLSGATTLDVTVTASDGTAAGEYQQACTAFATTISLAPGSYRAEAILLDSADRERTTPVQIRPFEILGNDQLTIPIEFPASSFYSP